MKRPLLPICAALLLGTTASAQADSLSCPESIKSLPRLVGDDTALEPSGVAWDPEAKVAIGVSDESSPYALFAFDPAAARGDKTIRATPLLTPAQVKQFQPVDLEGITRQPNGEFLATASHTLHKDKPRETMLRFRLKKKGGASWEIETIQPVQPSGGFHTWLSRSANPPWEAKLSQQEGEKGINVEGLGSSPDGAVLFGFRSPVMGDKPVVLSTRLEGNQTPTAAQWRVLKLHAKFEEGGILGIGKEPLGIRDMTALTGTPGTHLLLIGASGSGSDLPFQLGRWQQDQNEVTLVGRIPKGFRAEGITVLSDTGESQRLLLVSDKQGLVMECQSTLKKR
ncbi:MAG: DUF3616 domain-containing protein [Magnetococcales bacterium]|nr:DUF3616 domain-containing protein [Magnetococcales bacterium]